MVDDGSSDHSGIICKNIAESDSRFHYFRVENGGPSVARNIGLSHATGEYIGFCDSDDIISSNMYECLVGYVAVSYTHLERKGDPCHRRGRFDRKRALPSDRRAPAETAYYL